MLSVQPVGYVLVIRIYLVKDSISVTFFTGCESNDLKVFLSFLQEAQSIGPQRDINILEPAGVIHGDLDLPVLLTHPAFLAVEQSLVQVQYHHFFPNIIRIYFQLYPLTWNHRLVGQLHFFTRSHDLVRD